jgi:hypothetical protein
MIANGDVNFAASSFITSQQIREHTKKTRSKKKKKEKKKKGHWVSNGVGIG